MRYLAILLIAVVFVGCGQKGCPEGKVKYKTHCIAPGQLFSEPEEGVIILK